MTCSMGRAARVACTVACGKHAKTVTLDATMSIRFS